MEKRHTVLATWLHETPDRRPPIQSSDKMVASGFASVNACFACAMHSQSALVDKACWKGHNASFTASLNCWTTVLNVNLLITSPTTMPLTPPSGFRERRLPPQTNGLHCNFWRPALDQLLGHEEEHVHTPGVVQQRSEMFNHHP